MSFSNNCKPDKMPGPLKGNPLTGLCEKTCVQVDKVFDACIKQETLTDVSINLDDVTPKCLTVPYQFISAKSTGTSAEVVDLIISEIPDSCGCARVTCNVIIPVSVIFVDANGKQGMGYGKVSVSRDVVMHVASESVMPYSVIADATLVGPAGEFIGGIATDPTFKITCCATVILKVVMTVLLLVPSYGYAYIPACQEYAIDVCDGVFDLPLYPNDCGCDCKV